MIDYTEAAKLYSEGFTLREAAKACGVGYTSFQKYMSETGQSRGNRKHKNLVGERFGQLLVEEEHLEKDRRWWYICKCDCGNRQKLKGHQLARGNVVKCGECRRSGNKSSLWKGHGEISKTYWSALKRNAISRNISFEVPIEYAWEIYQNQKGRCAISGVSIPMTKTRRSEIVASLDRIDSLGGYTKDNIQWTHKVANRMKWDMPLNEFVEWCKIVAGNQ